MINYEEILQIFNYIKNFIYISPDIFKLTLIIVTSYLFVKYTKKQLKLAIKYLGNKFIKEPYLNSFFHNERIVSIAFYGIPLIFINYWAFDFNWFSISVEQSVDITNKINNDKKLLENFAYLSNYLYFGLWLSCFLKHTVNYLNQIEKYKNKPLHSFAQIIFIIFTIIAIATIYAHYTNQSPKTLFTTLSVMSVAVFLTLKDVILGIVSTILIITNNIVQVGDWIKNDKYHADGRIIEINLITVKVLNFDKTIVVIPTYSLVSEGFINQQEIINSGLRRIKQIIRIDPTTIKHLTVDELKKYKEIELLKPYIEKKLKKFEKNDNNEESGFQELNQEYVTNLGLFKQYILKYIEQNPMIFNTKNISNKSKKIKKEILEGNEDNIVVRIVEGTKEGVGIEIYCFSNDSKWENYEYLVSTLLEHIYATSHKFDITIRC